MCIKKFANNDVCCVSEDAPLKEAADCMKKKQVGSVVVVKNKDSDLTPVGILTDRDIVIELLANGTDPNKACVNDIVTKHVMTVKATDEMQDVIETMANKGVRRAPIVDDNNKLVGIVTFDDLLVLLVEKLSRLAEVVKKQKV